MLRPSSLCFYGIHCVFYLHLLGIHIFRLLGLSLSDLLDFFLLLTKVYLKYLLSFSMYL